MRSLTAGAIAALADPNPPLVLLVEMAFSPVLRLATASVDIDWNGHTWLAAGSLGSIEPVNDSAGDAQGLKFVLSNVPSANLSLALQSVRNKACTLYLAVLNVATHAIEDVSTVGVFVLDQMPITDAAKGGAGTVAVTALPRSRLFARPKPLGYNDGDQQRLHSGDRCLEFLVSQSTHQDVWPAASWGRK